MENYVLAGCSLFRLYGDVFIHVADVPPGIKSLRRAVKWYEGAGPMSAPEKLSDYVNRRFKGNKSLAAEQFGLNRSVIYQVWDCAVVWDGRIYRPLAVKGGGQS